MSDLKGMEGSDASFVSQEMGKNLPIRSGDDLEMQPGEIKDSDAINTEQAERDPNIVNWDGPDDPQNPMNWPRSKKIAAIGVVSFITFLSPLSSTIIAPATPEAMKEFNSTNGTLGAFVTSVYLLGYAFGPLAIAPLSELYGRSIMYNICNAIFVIFTIACALANSLGALIVFRFLAGIAASSPITLGAGSIADMVPQEKRGLAMALWMMGPVFGPTIGPLAGGYLADAKGWRWIFWLLAIVGGASCLISAAFMPESYAYVLLQRKTKRLQKETGNPNLRSALDTGKSPKQLFSTAIVRPMKMLFLSPLVFILSLLMAMIYGYLYLLFTTFPRVFERQYNFSQKSVGLVYMGPGVGALLGLVFTAAISDRLMGVLAKRNSGKMKPEYRLPGLFIGSLFVALGLFIYGWTADKMTHWIAPVIGTGLLGLGMTIAYIPGQTYLVDTYTVYAASVSAAATVFRSLLGALLPLVGDSMYNALGVGWGTSLLGFLAAAFIPVPVVLFVYGERIRQSRFSQVQF